ncbi:MAG TPA: enolase C-terminal domain-like protein [Terriglobales bacterium]
MIEFFADSTILEMRIVEIKERAINVSRYADASLGGQLSTSLVAIVTDARVDGEVLTGYGFGSFGRFAQSGLIRERFAAKLLAAPQHALLGDDRQFIDPIKAWGVMMLGEKPGGHGERCVAVGTLDMALWDLAAKFKKQPLHRLVAKTFGRQPSEHTQAYAGGGYYFPTDDIPRLTEEIQHFHNLGLNTVKIKVGSASTTTDTKRIEAALDVVGSTNRLAIDAMNNYDHSQAIEAAHAFVPYGLRWFEDICDPLDYETHKTVAQQYAPPISAGEAIFSLSDARNLFRYAGLRPQHDTLTFDPVHCYGIPEFVRVIEAAERSGWSRQDFFPHGGHLFGLHVACGLGLGGCECNPHNFQPLGGFGDGSVIRNGTVSPPDAPGIGFETKSNFMDLIRQSF